MSIADCTGLFGRRRQLVWDFHPFKIVCTSGSTQIPGHSTPRVSGSVCLGWDPRISISNKLPDYAIGDAASPGTTATGLHCPNMTGHLFWEFCFECTPSRRENSERVDREEKEKGQQNISFLLQKGS